MQWLESTMLLSMIPALIAVALFVATLALRPNRARATMLPPQAAARKC